MQLTEGNANSSHKSSSKDRARKESAWYSENPIVKAGSSFVRKESKSVNKLGKSIAKNPAVKTVINADRSTTKAIRKAPIGKASESTRRTITKYGKDTAKYANKKFKESIKFGEKTLKGQENSFTAHSSKSIAKSTGFGPTVAQVNRDPHVYKHAKKPRTESVLKNQYFTSQHESSVVHKSGHHSMSRKSLPRGYRFATTSKPAIGLASSFHPASVKLAKKNIAKQGQTEARKRAGKVMSKAKSNKPVKKATKKGKSLEL